jgi:tetratricopeptide (TPR) repeat protein
VKLDDGHMKRMKMKRFYILLAVLILLCCSSCGRKVTPALGIGKRGTDYNDAMFNSLYVEGIKQKLLGNGGEALKYMEQCVKIKPASDASFYQMAQIVILNGDVSNGKRYALKAYRIDEDNVWYLMMLGGIYYQEKKLDSAIIYYEIAVKSFPEKEDLQFTLGNLYSENKNYEKAVSVFSSFDERYGINESSTVAVIKNLMAEEKYKEALMKVKLLHDQYPQQIIYSGLMAEIFRGMGEKDKALEVYNKLLEENPEDAQTQLSICDFLIVEKSFDELFNFLNTVILNNNVTREDKISLLARLLDQQEVIKQHSDKFMLALMVLEANFKNDEIFVLFRPELLIKLKKLDEAAECLDKITIINPQNYYAWEKLLFVYLEMKDFKKLTVKGEECASMFNRSFLAKILYANGASETGKYDIALEELRKAAILAGDNQDSLIQVLTMKADVYYKMKDYKKAFETFDEALKSNREDLTIINNYAYYMAEQNMNLKEAEKMAKKVVDTEKGNTTFMDTYGWVLYKRGKLKEAARIFEEIIISNKEPDAVWYEHYGYVLKKQNKCSLAILNWEIALKTDSTRKILVSEIENCRK